YESHPVTGADAHRSDRVRAARGNCDAEAHRDTLAAAQRKAAVDPAARLWGVRGSLAPPRSLETLAQEDPGLEPRQRDRLSIRDLERRDRLLSGDQPGWRQRQTALDPRA